MTSRDGDRFDYARLRYATDHDLAQQRRQELVELIELWCQSKPDMAGGGHEFRVFPGSVKGSSQYCLEIWGQRAEVITWLDYTEHADRLMRLDVRRTLEGITPKGIDTLGQRLQAKKGIHNVNRYSTKSRTKQRGRNAGGVGVALGSHKSQWRASAYKRGNEPGALEFQYSGPALATCTNNIHARRIVPEVDADPWGKLRAHMMVNGIQRLERASGSDYDQLVECLFGLEPVARDEVVEQLCFDIQVAFRQLPPAAKREVYANLQSMEF